MWRSNEGDCRSCHHEVTAPGVTPRLGELSGGFLAGNLSSYQSELHVQNHYQDFTLFLCYRM